MQVYKKVSAPGSLSLYLWFRILQSSRKSKIFSVLSSFLEGNISAQQHQGLRNLSIPIPLNTHFAYARCQFFRFRHHSRTGNVCMIDERHLESQRRCFEGNISAQQHQGLRNLSIPIPLNTHFAYARCQFFRFRHHNRTGNVCMIDDRHLESQRSCYRSGSRSYRSRSIYMRRRRSKLLNQSTPRDSS